MNAAVGRCPSCFEEIHVVADGKEYGHLYPCIPEPDAVRRTMLNRELYEKAKDGVMTEDDLWRDLGKTDLGLSSKEQDAAGEYGPA